MKTRITLKLKTREVYHLFQRRIYKNQLFMDLILHKINQLVGVSRKPNPNANCLISDWDKRLHAQIQVFNEEINCYQQLLKQKSELHNKVISFVVQFTPEIIVMNSLGLSRVTFIEVYDELIATIKLLHLAGCFTTNESYFFKIKDCQKTSNRLLSGFLARLTC